MTTTAPEIDITRPYLTGSGPTVFSTCTAVMPMTWIADVNGWYATLGVDPRAGKAQLRDAYLARGGPRSAYLTHVLRRLLDRNTRQQYDRMKLGTQFPDKYIQETVQSNILRNSSPEQLHRLSEHVVRIVDRGEDLLQAFLDNISPRVHDGRTSSKTQYPFSYYLFRSEHDDLATLARWQYLVIQACRMQQIQPTVALGFHATGPDPWLVLSVGMRTVVFLHEECPASQLHAEAAISHLVSLKEHST